jgi:hypothetical protein
MQIRDVTAADVPAMAALADAKRTEYAIYSPVSWRKSENGLEVQTRFFTNRMLPSDTIISLVADTDGTIEGFVIGMIHEAPPVYDPGGPVCWIDDFTVSCPELWETMGTAPYREMQVVRTISVNRVTIVNIGTMSVYSRKWWLDKG